MPFTTISTAKEAGFPTTAEDIPLTLSQINKLASIYDAIKKSGSAKESFAAAWTQWKKIYRKEGDKWITAELIGAEVPASNYDSKTHIVKAIRIGTVAHTSSGELFECTEAWLEARAGDWNGGSLIANHYSDSPSYGDITKSWWASPFVMMELANLNPEAESRMLSGEHTGFSFDAVGSLDNPADVIGTNLSILFYPHAPACSAADGCGLTAEEQLAASKTKNIELQSLIDKIRGENFMTEGKTLTDKEIETLKAEAAEGATLRLTAERLEGEVSARDATIAAKDVEIEKQMAVAAEMFTTEDVDTKVTEAKATMFSAEDVETAKKDAVEAALVEEKEKIDRIAAELSAITKMFPDGLDDTFRAEVVAMVKEGKSHEALVKLGEEINYKELKASVPTGAGKETTEDDDVAKDAIYAASTGAGVYDPLTNTFSAGE